MARLAIVGIVLLLVGPILATLELVPPFVGFVLYGVGGLLGLIAAIGGLVSLIRGRGVRALALAIVPAGIFVASFATGMDAPPINDIATNVDDPPAFVHALTLPENAGRDFAYREDFKEVVRTAYPDLQALRLARPPADVYAAVIDRMRANGWAVTRDDAEQLTVEGVVTSKLFKFRDDVVVRVRADGEAAVVDMRSKSRDGIGDRGVNAARIRAFLDALKSA
ncbi:MAG: DUF1499 domain-containing protein [Candidatus Binatia bacterium]